MSKQIFVAIGTAALIGAAVFFLKPGSGPKSETENQASSGEAGAGKGTGPGVGSAKIKGTGLVDAAAEEAAKAARPASSGPDSATVKTAAGDDKAYLKEPPLSAKEIKSVKTLVSTFVKYDRGRAGLNSFIKELTDAGLEPLMAKDENPYTGKMLVVRTKGALEGTRYLHAQYFEDDDKNKEPFRQHISFEIRGSPNCMSEAKAAIEGMLGKKLGTPVKPPTDSWVEWHVDGYSWWIHRLTLDDIPNNPYNARTKRDVGVCEVAKQQIPEEEGEEH